MNSCSLVVDVERKCEQQISRKELKTGTNLHMHQTKVSSLSKTLLLLYYLFLWSTLIHFEDQQKYHLGLIFGIDVV